MDMLHYFLFSFLLSFLYLSRSIFLRIFQNLPPSPPLSLPLLGHLYLFKQPLHLTLAKISKKYGPVLLLQFGSRPVLVVSSPSAAEECFTKNDVVFANRPSLLAGKHLGYNYTTLVWASHGDNWRNLRRIASIEMLSAHRVELFGDTRRYEVRHLVKRLAKGSMSEDGFRVVDMKSVFFEMVLNVLMVMIGGKRYYDDDDLGQSEERGKFQDIVTETFKLSGASNIGDFIPILRWIGVDGLENKLKALQVKRDNFMQDLIDERRGKTKGTTLIDVLLSLQTEDPQNYSDKMIRGMMQVLLSAGTDTSATTMEWTMSLLLNNPDELAKAQAEIDREIGHSRLVHDSDLSNLPHLHRIIKESLRMYPAGPMLVPHESSKDCVVGGYRVPRGALLLVNIWAIQNDPDTWDSPAEFRSERFVGFEGRKQGSFLLMPFGFGRRRCPGENMAMRVVGVALAALIQCFDWERVGPEMVDMSVAPGLTTPKALPLLAKCRPRLAADNLISQL